MDVDRTQRVLTGRSAQVANQETVSAIIGGKWLAEKVIIDLGSTHTLVDFGFVKSRGPPLKRYNGPSI